MDVPHFPRRSPGWGLDAAAYGMILAGLLLTWPGWRTIYDVEMMLRVTRAIFLEHTVAILDPKSGQPTHGLYGLGQSLLFLPFVLLAFDRFWAKRNWSRALLVGLLLALQGLSSVYLGAITALALAAAVACGIAGGLGRRDLGKLAVGLGLAALLMAPAVWPYLRMRAFQGMEWTLGDVANYATTLTSYAAGGTRLWGPVAQRHLDPDLIRDTLFPGLTVLVLGLVGLARAPRRYRAVVVLASALAILFSSYAVAYFIIIT